MQTFAAGTEVTCVAFDPAENRVVAGTKGGSVKVWELESSRQTQTISAAHLTAVKALEFYPLARPSFLASGGADGVVHLWHLTSGERLGSHSTHTAGGVSALRFAPHGLALVSGGADGKLVVRVAASPGLCFVCIICAAHS